MSVITKTCDWMDSAISCHRSSDQRNRFIQLAHLAGALVLDSGSTPQRVECGPGARCCQRTPRVHTIQRTCRHHVQQSLRLDAPSNTTSLTTTTRQAGPTRQRPTTIGTNGKKILQTFFPTRHTKSQEPDGLRTDSKHRTLNLTSFSTLSSCCCCCRTTLRAAIAVFRRTKIPFTSLVPATTTTAAASTKVRSSCFPDHHPLSRPRTRPLSNPAYRDRSLHYSNIWKRQLRDPAPDDFPAQLGFDRRRRQKKQRDQIFWRGEQLYDWKPERRP